MTLSIAPAAGSGHRYYAALAVEGYYRNGDQPGQWHGDVDKREFDNLFRGFSPDGSCALVQNIRQKQRRQG